MTSIRRLCALVAALAALSATIALAGGTSEGATAAKKVEISLWSGYPDLQGFYDRIATQFSAQHPNISVKVQTFSLTDLDQKLATAVPSNTAADVLELISIASFPYAEKFFAEVPKELQASVNGVINPEYLHDVMYNNKMLGVPFCFYSEVLYWNKDQFAEAGLSAAPDTMDQLVSDAVKLTKYDGAGNVTRSGISLRFSGHPSGTCEKFWALGLLPYGGDIISPAGQAGKYHAGFEGDPGYNALKLYVDLLYKYKVTDFNIKQDADAFAAGLAAMFEREQWVVGTLKQTAPKLNYAASVLPKAKRRATFAITRNMFVPEATKEKSAAWEFVNYFYSKPVMTAMVSETGWLSTRKDLDYASLLKDSPQLLAGVQNPPDLQYVWQKRLRVENEIMNRMGDRLTQLYRDASLAKDDAKIRQQIGAVADMANGILKDAGLYAE